MSDAMTKGQKIAKVFFFLAFAPYAIVLVLFIFGCIADGFDGGAFGALMILYLMCEYAVIPLCLIYQIGYILRKTVLKKVQLKKVVIVFGAIAAVVCGVILVDAFSYEIEYAFMKIGARSMLARADEIAYYNFKQPPATDTYPRTKNVFDIEGAYESVLVDYDSRQVGILCGGTLDKFWKVTLEADNGVANKIKKDYIVQAVIPLENQDGKLITFSDEENNRHRTIAIILECEDGVFCADEIRERDTGFVRFSGLQWSQYYVGENLTAEDFDEEWNLITTVEEN
ncbi:MAG: hypothetical protein IJ035_05005 [Oscillospiraceae bacterium]|nr:hypothetical protein [Oscillospiraceae bacterium]